MDAGIAALIGSAIGLAGGLGTAALNARTAFTKDRIARTEAQAEMVRGLMVEIYNEAADGIDWLDPDRTEDSVTPPWETEWAPQTATALRNISEARTKAAIVAARAKDSGVRELADEIHADLGKVRHHWGEALGWARHMLKAAPGHTVDKTSKQFWLANCSQLEDARKRLRGAEASSGDRPLPESSLYRLRDLVRST